MKKRLASSFKTKILVGYGAAVFLVAVVFLWSVLNLLTLGQATESILSENYRSILAAENMVKALERQDSLLLGRMLGLGEDEGTAFQAMEGEFYQWLSRAKDNVTIPKEKDILPRLERGYGDFLTQSAPLISSPPLDDAGAYYKANVLPLFLTVREACHELGAINQQAMVTASDQARALALSAVWRTTGAGVVVVALGLALSLLLSSRLAKPVVRMREATLRIADGDYDARVPVTGSDELASLAEHFNAMTASLKQFHDLNIGKILAEKHKTEAILHSVDDGIVVLSPTLEITSINPMAAHIFGVSSEKMVGQPFMKMEGGEPLHEPLRLALEREGVSEAWGSDDILSVPAGEDQAHYQYSIIPVTIGSGPVIAVVILLRDVTRLKELDRLKSEFVMTASHELRTPLTSIGMSVELLLENNAENLNERGQELLRMAKEDVGRLKALVSELLDLSKIEAGRLEIEFEKVPVALLCSKTMDVMQEQARQAEISLSVDCPDELPKVRVDPNKLTWVLVNLVGNALRHTREGGTVRIHAERIGDFVHFAVADNGEGIPPEYQNKIFDKFVQVKSGRTSGGSGLGLAICKEIVRAHGGTIWVDSIAAQGSTFTFTVPVFQS